MPLSMKSIDAQLDTQEKLLYKKVLNTTFCDDGCSIYALLNTIATSHIMTTEHLKCS